MNILKNKYIITGWNGMKYYLTAEELKNKVLADAKSSDYNWFAPAKEIIKACNDSSFPTEDARFIKITVLNCFTKIENMSNICGDHYKSAPENDVAIINCYNSLSNIKSPDVILARKNYLKEILHAASDPVLIDPLSSLSNSSTFISLRQKWIKEKFNELFNKEITDLATFRQNLENDFSRTFKKAKSDGLFTQYTLKEAATFESIIRAIKPNTFNSEDPEILH